uniref:Late embryogenesis abundant protein, LEA-14 n=1 Tax=Tanacetum cinerariifolium TaxID=118510 RepID=A0A699KQ70_TANCI|nr:late embryogenesis abundant protein, LEA-14 [Tanacetum cinerariifolium]
MESSGWLASGWMSFSSSGSTVDSSTKKQPLQGSHDHDNVPAQFSMASYSGKGMKSVEEENRKIADLPNSCRQIATSSRDEDPGSEVTLGGRIISFTCETAKKNSFSLNQPLTLFRVGLTRMSKQSPQPRKRTPG